MADYKGAEDRAPGRAGALRGPRVPEVVGRKGTVDDAIVDEKGQVHVRTKEDGVWCPARLVAAF